MKKTFKLVALLSSLLLLAGCLGGNNGGEGDQSGDAGNSSGNGGNTGTSAPAGHVHNWVSTWSKDTFYHWHACTGCEEVNDKAEHRWDTGTVTKQPGEYTQGEKRFTCQDCGRTKTEIVNATGGNEAQGNFTFTDSELTTAQPIHDANQKKYLTTITDYYHVTKSQLDGCNATGDKSNEHSLPLQVTVSWSYTAPQGKTVSKFQFVYGQRQDLGDAYIFDGSTSQQVSFYNPYLGDNYFKVIANLSDGSKEASQVKVFKVETEAPRNLKIGNLSNCRDMGGRITVAGGKVKQGLIYRTCGNKFLTDNPSGTTMNDEAKNVMLKQLKVKTEINVSNDATYNMNLNGVEVKACCMDYGATPYSNFARNAEKIRNVFDLLADQSNYPVFYHCRIGTDRTGITGILIDGLLGVPFQETIQDYGFSNFGRIGGQRYANKPSDPDGDDCAKYVDEILAMPGANFQEQVYNALLSIGCSKETLNRVIDIMTEGNKATLPNTALIGKGGALVSNGTKEKAADYTKPDISYAISNNKTVSYTATTTAGQKDIVVYLGSTNSDKTAKLASGISLMIDDQEQTIVDKTMFLAGFGTTGQNRRTGYMFQLLGNYNLAAGEHTFTITAKSGTFNVGTICVFDHTASA